MEREIRYRRCFDFPADFEVTDKNVIVISHRHVFPEKSSDKNVVNGRRALGIRHVEITDKNLVKWKESSGIRYRRCFDVATADFEYVFPE